MNTLESATSHTVLSASDVDQLLTRMMPALAASVTEAEPQYMLMDGLPREQRVVMPEKSARGWSCQQLASLVRETLRREGVANAHILKKDLRYIGPNFLEHVVVSYTLNDEQWYVDPTYSQIFKHFGLHFHQLRPDYSPYPDELHVMYRAEEVELLATWAATVMKMYWQNHGYTLPFQQAYGYTTAEDGWDSQRPVIQNQPVFDEMERVFYEVWSAEGYEIYEGNRSIHIENLAKLYANALRLQSAA